MSNHLNRETFTGFTSKIRPSRNVKISNRYRTKQQSCPQYFRSNRPAIYWDNENGTLTSLHAMKMKGPLPFGYSNEHIRQFDYKYLQKCGRKPSPRTSSTPILQSLGDTDDTEDEGFCQYRGSFSSVSSQGSYDVLRRQAMSMGSLTSSYSSLGERSASTLSSLDDQGSKHTLSTSLKAILDPDYSGDFDYDQDPTMREAIENIVSPKPIRTASSSQYKPPSPREVPASNVAAVDPSILVAFVNRDSNKPKVAPTKYCPTALCDLRGIIDSPAPEKEVAESRADLAQLRIGTQPVNDTIDAKTREGWNIPAEEEEEEEVLLETTKIPYRTLSETSESEEDSCLLSSYNLSRLSHNGSSSLSTISRSRSSSISSIRDSSDYLADISDEETTTRPVTTWPTCKKLKLHLEQDGVPFVLSPRIPGVAYYGAPTSILVASSGHCSGGLDAFFSSRSIVHRLGPHGQERVYDMEQCPEKCGFAYPVPPKQEVLF